MCAFVRACSAGARKLDALHEAIPNGSYLPSLARAGNLMHNTRVDCHTDPTPISGTRWQRVSVAVETSLGCTMKRLREGPTAVRYFMCLMVTEFVLWCSVDHGGA